MDAQKEIPAMSLFGFFGPPDVQKLSFQEDIPGLIKALTYRKDAGVRRSAALALGAYPDERSVGPLVAALTDDAFDVRNAAAEALQSVDIRWSTSEAARAAVPGLTAAMKDQGPFGSSLRTVEGHQSQQYAAAVRAAAATILGKIRDARATDALLEAVQKNHDGYVRSTAAEMLGEIKDRRAIKPLLGALIDTEYFVCKAAARALPKIDSDWAKSDAARAAVPMFIAALTENQKKLQALAASPEKPATDFTPDLEVPISDFRHQLRVVSEQNSTTVSWAAKEALMLVGAWVEGPGSS